MRALATVWPEAEAGVVKAERNEYDARDIVFASVQTAWRDNRLANLRGFDLVVADECFPATVRVGGVPISEIRIGSIVPVYDEDSKRVVMGRVGRVFRRRARILARVVTDRGPIVTTVGHPFLGRDGWRMAGGLTSGDMVLYTMTHAQPDMSILREAGTPETEAKEIVVRGVQKIQALSGGISDQNEVSRMRETIHGQGASGAGMEPQGAGVLLGVGRLGPICTVEHVSSGKYDDIYPTFANEARDLRKELLGTLDPKALFPKKPTEEATELPPTAEGEEVITEQQFEEQRKDLLTRGTIT